MSAHLRHARAVRVAFGSALRGVRIAAGMSQKTLAMDAQVARAYPSLLERGLRGPSLVVVFALAHALDVDPVVLVHMTHWHLGDVVRPEVRS